LKPIQELILTSATYRQSSQGDPATVAADPENLLVGRQARRRLEAEPIRDAMLAVSGLLDRRMFGPGTLDDHMRRRSVYFMVKRSQLVRFLTLFDGPDALVPLAQRAETVVAPQALLLINSPVVREWAEALARRARPEATVTLDEVVERAYRLALLRAPREEERAAARAFLARQVQAHAAAGREEAETAALADFCQVLLSTNEFIYIE
jgi:hypothetical protein